MSDEYPFSEIAFKQLYDRYKNRIYGYALTITHSTHAAEEITQELFIKLWTNRESLDNIDNIEHYIFTMARNRTLNYLRKAANDAQLLAHLRGAMVFANNEVEDYVIIDDYKAIVEKAINQLSPQRRMVFRLSRYEGLKMEEIAQQLHLSRNTVKNHLAAALRFIRTYLARHGVTFLLLGSLLLS